MSSRLLLIARFRCSYRPWSLAGALGRSPKWVIFDPFGWLQRPAQAGSRCPVWCEMWERWGLVTRALLARGCRSGQRRLSPWLSRRTLEGVVYARGASFVGRAAELDELCDLLDARSLVTIVGEGGVGKTRLAREVADTLAASDWPVWWTDLGAATGPSGVRSSFEDSLRPVGRDVSFEELIEERVPAGRCLMVIDNCEHVLDDIVARIELLGSVRPEMRVLATSRIRLGLSGEVAYRLLPLDVPSRDAPLERVGDIASVALLIDRVRDVISDFSLDESNAFDLASIARNSEGVPLAIELVAAAAGAVPLSEIARDLRESLGMGAVDARREPRRHRSLDASVKWSVDRLDPSTDVALRRLGAFAESFRFDIAVRVISDAGDRHDRRAARSFVELVEASLVRRLADDRYSLPMAVRTLAVEELDATAEVSEVRDRHAEAITDVVVEVKASVQAAGDVNEVWLRLLDHELPEIRAAIGWQLHRGRPEKAAELVGHTYDHAHIRGRYGEVLAQCRTILAHPDLDRATGATLAATASLRGCHGGATRRQLRLLGAGGERFRRSDRTGERVPRTCMERVLVRAHRWGHAVVRPRRSTPNFA